MKKILFPLFLTMPIWAFYACNNTPQALPSAASENISVEQSKVKAPPTPEEVAMEFTKALADLDFDKARTLGDSTTRELMGLIEGMAMANQGQIPKNPNAGKSARCITNGNKSECSVCCDEEGKDTPVELVKINDKWLVATNKENTTN